MKSQLKERAIILRKEGFSYSEIRRQIPVAKSTLSLWLYSVNLSKKQKQRLSNKKLFASIRGGESKKMQRLEITKKIIKQSISEITNISKKEIWFMGIMLYWAEGSKSKEHNPSQGVCFSNSDPLMIKLFLLWLKVLKVSEERIYFDIYIHENYKEKIQEFRQYWIQTTGLLDNKFDKIYFKKHKLSTNRKNTSNGYHGLLRVRVKESTNLNRKISGWIEGICIRCGIV